MISELELQVANTAAFIAVEPVDLVLIPRARVSDGAGGFRLTTGTPREPQTFRMLPRNDKVPEVQTADGKTAQPEFTLLGMPGIECDRYDTFEFDGRTWEVAQVHMRPAYEWKGDVVRRV